MLSVLYLHDNVTSWRHVMTSKTGGTSSQLVGVLERWFFVCFYSFPACSVQKMLSFLCLHDVMTSWRDVMTSQNSLLLYQLVDVLKWWYTCISIIISIAGFQANVVYVLAWWLHVITWCHDVTKITTWRQETNCLHPSLQMCSRADSISFLWFLWLLNSTWLLSSYLHDGITLRTDVMTYDVTKHAVSISARWRASEMVLFLSL